MRLILINDKVFDFLQSLYIFARVHLMRKNLYTYITICTTILWLGFSSCSSSEELLYPIPYQYAQQEIQVLNDINFSHIKAEQTNFANTVDDIAIPDELLQKYAMMLGLVPKEMSNYILYNFIEEWYGVRYRYGGTGKDGIDCSAFAQELYKNVFSTELVRTARQQFSSCKAVMDTNNLNEGDLVFFRTRGRSISHVGIYLANDYFVHASSSQGVMISNLNNSYWSKRYAGAGKVPDKNSKSKQML